MFLQPPVSVCAGANVVEEVVAVVTARTCRCSPLLDGGRVCCCTGWFAFIGIACIAAVTSVVAIVVVDAAPALPLHVAKESIVARTSVVNADCKFITFAIATMLLLPFFYAMPLHPRHLLCRPAVAANAAAIVVYVAACIIPPACIPDRRCRHCAAWRCPQRCRFRVVLMLVWFASALHLVHLLMLRSYRLSLLLMLRSPYLRMMVPRRLDDRLAHLESIVALLVFLYVAISCLCHRSCHWLRCNRCCV